MRVLVIEDNAAIAANIGDYLEAAGHACDFAGDGRVGLNLVLAHDYDVIVLDLALPRLDGIDLCLELRAAAVDTPVLMLTARDTLEEKLAGFDAGADDYLVKPFLLEELVVRLQALDRRFAGRAVDGMLRVGDLEYDPRTLRGRRGGRDIALNPAQRRLLECLMRNSDRVVSRAELEEALWGDEPPERDVLRAHIHLLRRAIDRGFGVKLLHTVPGAGYRLAEPDAL